MAHAVPEEEIIELAGKWISYAKDANEEYR
jgi:hypothetical protein